MPVPGTRPATSTGDPLIAALAVIRNAAALPGDVGRVDVAHAVAVADALLTARSQLAEAHAKAATLETLLNPAEPWETTNEAGRRYRLRVDTRVVGELHTPHGWTVLPERLRDELLRRRGAQLAAMAEAATRPAARELDVLGGHQAGAECPPCGGGPCRASAEPEPGVPEGHEAGPCSACGMTDVDCDEAILRDGRNCCRTCAVHVTHESL